MQVTPLFSALYSLQPNGWQDCVLTADHWFLVTEGGEEYVAGAPAGMVYDGWSVPWGFRNLISPRSNRGQAGGAIHDAGYQGVAIVYLVVWGADGSFALLPHRDQPKAWWDRAFLACNAGTGVPWWRRQAAYRAVAWFGPWKRARRRGAPEPEKDARCLQWSIPVAASLDELRQDARLSLLAHGPDRYQRDLARGSET
jgi:hypothetical protein